MKYYYSADGKSVEGPASEEQLGNLVADGFLQAETQVCREGQQEWMPITSILSFKGRRISAAPVVVIPPSRLHPTARSVTLISCPACEKPVSKAAASCPDCGHPINEVGSGPVIVTAIQNVIPAQVQQHPKWNAGIAVVLSFFIPGLGQMYKGEVLNGIFWLVVVIVGYALFVIPGLILHVCCMVGAGSGNPYK